MEPAGGWPEGSQGAMPSPNRRFGGFLRKKLALFGRRTCFTQFVLSTRSVLWASNMPKMRWRSGLCPGPRWGSSRRSPRPRSWLGRGTPHPQFLSPRRLRRLVSRAFTLSFCALNVKSWLHPWEPASKVPDTHASETVFRNSCHRPKFDARFKRQFFCADVRLLTSLTAFGTRSLSVGTKNGTQIWRRIYGADVWSRFLKRVSGV